MSLDETLMFRAHAPRYFNKDTVGLDFEGMKADIKAAPEGSIVRSRNTERIG